MCWNRLGGHRSLLRLNFFEDGNRLGDTFFQNGEIKILQATDVPLQNCRSKNEFSSVREERVVEGSEGFCAFFGRHREEEPKGRCRDEPGFEAQRVAR